MQNPGRMGPWAKGDCRPQPGIDEARLGIGATDDDQSIRCWKESMATLRLWHWLIVLVVVAIIFAMPKKLP